MNTVSPFTDSGIVKLKEFVMPTAAQILIEKIQTLPPERVAEVADFVEFLRLKEQDHQLVRAAAQASAPAFAAAWDNKEDEAYDAL